MYLKETVFLIFLFIGFIFILKIMKKEKQKDTKSLFNEKLFKFFVKNHNLYLLDGEINDIKNEVYAGIFQDLPNFSYNELDDLFLGVICEMNRRKRIENSKPFEIESTPDKSEIFDEYFQNVEKREAY